MSLVTWNVSDFPDDRTPAGLDVVSPDQFVLKLAADEIGAIADVIQRQASALANPAMTVEQLLDGLEQIGLIRSVAALRDAAG